jgi:hypothetical protein
MQRNLVCGDDHCDDRRKKAIGSSSGGLLGPPRCSGNRSIDRELAQDYSGINGLMARLDEQIHSFANNLTQLNEHAPNHTGLAVLWEEHAKSIRCDIRIKGEDMSACEKKTKSAPATTTP